MYSVSFRQSCFSSAHSPCMIDWVSTLYGVSLHKLCEIVRQVDLRVQLLPRVNTTDLFSYQMKVAQYLDTEWFGDVTESNLSDHGGRTETTRIFNVYTDFQLYWRNSYNVTWPFTQNIFKYWTKNPLFPRQQSRATFSIMHL